MAGALAGSAVANVTDAPPAPAPLVNVTVPVTVVPPTTAGALRLTDARAGPTRTVSVDDALVPLIVAVIVAVPA